MTNKALNVQITLDDSVVCMITDDPELRSHTVEFHVNQIVREHYQRKLMAKMPKPKEVILANFAALKPGASFIGPDLMDSLHKRDPKLRGDYGRALSLMIARKEIAAEFTGVHKDTYKVYRKR